MEVRCTARQRSTPHRYAASPFARVGLSSLDGSEHRTASKRNAQAMDDMALDLARIALDFKHLVEPQHPDDAAVDALAVLMKAKLAKQRAKGYGGWNDKTQCPQQRLSDMLRAHVDKGDPVDVANFCAMLSARGEGIAAAPQAVQAAVPTIAELEASAELGALRDVYEMARGVLRFDGIDMERALKYKDGLIEAIETVKTIDGGTWEPEHPAEGVPALNLETLEMPTNPHSAAGDPVSHVAWAAGAGAVFAAAAGVEVGAGVAYGRNECGW